MRAATCVGQSAENPLSGLVLGDVPEPEARPGWTRVRIVATSVNMHDLWTLRGVGHPAERLPMILGCDAAGYDEQGRRVVVYPIIADPDAGGGDETLDPGRALLSERHNGTFAEVVSVPDRCVLPMPESLSFEEAAALPVAWGTAYRMLFTQAGVKAGSRVLVQGVGGGVASAAIRLAVTAGAVVYASSRSEAKRAAALEWGVRAALEPGERLPERVDAVIETVGAATWAHSLTSLRRGGTVVVCGATTGDQPPADLSRVFYQQLRVVGSTGCTRTEMLDLLRMVEATGVRPVVDRVLPLEQVHDALRLMESGDTLGKVILVTGATPPATTGSLPRQLDSGAPS